VALIHIFYNSMRTKHGVESSSVFSEQPVNSLGTWRKVAIVYIKDKKWNQSGCSRCLHWN